MTLAKILLIDTTSMSREELLAMEFAERRWHEVGKPTTRWGLIALLRSVINDVLDSLIECPSILLERRRDLRRGRLKIVLLSDPDSRDLEFQMGNGERGQIQFPFCRGLTNEGHS
jgi:hypothetical protein